MNTTEVLKEIQNFSNPIPKIQNYEYKDTTNTYNSNWYPSLSSMFNNTDIIINSDGNDYIFSNNNFPEYNIRFICRPYIFRLPKLNESIISMYDFPNNIYQIDKLYKMVIEQFDLCEQHLVGKELITNQGLKVKILTNAIDVQFEDNVITRITYKDFENTYINYPYFTGKTSQNLKYNNISGHKIKTYKQNVYYKCTCDKCNWGEAKILTAQQFLKHGKECI